LTVYAYTRGSTHDQVLTLQGQREVCASYCRHRQLGPPRFFEDAGVSSRKPFVRRPAGGYLFSHLMRGDHLVIAKLDRAWRNTRECLATVEWLDMRGVTLHLVDLGGASMDLSSPFGRFFLTMISAVAELERSQISERTKAGLAVSRAQGRVGGFVNGLDTPVFRFMAEEVQRLVKRFVSRPKVVYALNARIIEVGRDVNTPRGIMPRRAKIWSVQMIDRLLRGLKKRQKRRGRQGQIRDTS